MKTAVQVTVYLNESDKWNQILQMLRRENVAGASALHAVAGFNGRNRVHTAGLVEAGGDLPAIVTVPDRLGWWYCLWLPACAPNAIHSSQSARSCL
ncbi:MAG: DUF190 domain-containing protein [Bryobacterales bacterium]|nr:DUF190 domain-containing protein [Bryobacterales bacterium]